MQYNLMKECCSVPENRHQVRQTEMCDFMHVWVHEHFKRPTVPHTYWSHTTTERRQLEITQKVHSTMNYDTISAEKNQPDSECNVRSSRRRRHVVMISLLAEIWRVDRLDQFTDGHRRHVHVHGELQFPRTDFSIRINARKPQPGTRAITESHLATARQLEASRQQRTAHCKPQILSQWETLTGCNF